MPEEENEIRRKALNRCYLCQSEGDIVYHNVKDRLYNVPGEWNLRRCRSDACGFVWIDPMPLESEIWKLYRDYFTHNESNTDTADVEVATLKNIQISFLKSKLKRNLFSIYYNYDEFKSDGLVSALAKFLTKFSLFRSRMGRKVMWLDGTWRTRLLDYGCGNGSFLGQMKNLGWDATGFELDQQAAKVASESFGVKVYSGKLSEIANAEEPFDVITLGHVIEHLPDPIGTLKECSRLLKPGGRLVIVTPNFDSLGRKYFAESWRPLETPRHLCLLNQKTLSSIAEKSGLKVESIWTHADSASGIWRRSKVIKREGQLQGGNPASLPSYAKKGSKLFSSIERLFTKFTPCGEEMVAIVKKR